MSVASPAPFNWYLGIPSALGGGMRGFNYLSANIGAGKALDLFE